MQYVYKHSVYHTTTGVMGVDPAQEALDTTDFETNYKASAAAVSEVVVEGTHVYIDKTYTQFKALITGDITWGMVLYVTGAKSYDLYLITDTSL